MPKREIQYRPLKKISIGDMRERIAIETRSIKAPTFGSVSFTENYSNTINTWAKVETNFSRRYFDGVNIEGDNKGNPSHKFTIRYRTNVTTESRIRYKDVLYRILLLNNFEQRDEYLELYARIDGDDTLEANQ